MATIIEILDRVRGSITGYISDLKTVAKNNLVAAINELFLKFVYGNENQAIVPKSDNSSEYRAIDIVVRGAFVATDAELAAAKLITVSPATVFSTWKRFSHGGGTFASGTPVLSNVIPGIPLETNSWSYNSGTNTINSTVNSATHIGFYSPEKYYDYTHSVTFSASGGDNDFIATIIAYVEDKNDMVANNAFGLNPADFSWPIDVTSQFIPNQHTLTLVRGRTNQVGHPFPTPARYAIVYDMGKLTQQIVVNGETSGVWNTTNSFSASPTVDVKVIRSGDLIKAYTTDWSDAPTGKGALRFELSYDLSSLDITNKFRGSASYGFSAITQQNSTFTNDFFSQNINSIYDVRNGQKWVGDNAGNYTLSATETLYTDFGANRLFFNPTTRNFIEVWPDRTFSIVGGGSTRFGIEDNTSDVDRSVDFLNHAVTFENLNNLYFHSTDGTYNSEIFQNPNGVGYDTYDADRSTGMNSYIDGGQSTVTIFGQSQSANSKNAIEVTPNNIRINLYDGTNPIQKITVPYVAGGGNKNLPMSVNGNFADATGNITIASTGGGGGTSTGDMLLANYIVDEPLSGTVNGTNTVFTFASPVVTNKEMIFLNGAKQRRGVDYTMTNSTTATFTIAPTTDGGTDYLDATYFKQ